MQRNCWTNPSPAFSEKLFVSILIPNPFVAIMFSSMKATKYVYILFTALVGLWCAGILAAPYFFHGSAASEARELYALFSRVCHQQDARSFHLCGEKFGVCIRCTAIYFSFFAGLLLYPVLRSLRQLSAPSKNILMLMTIPMLLDVCLNFLGVFPSSTMSRVITGSIFGFFATWFIVPSLTEAVHQILKKKNMKVGDIHYVRKTA